MDLKEKNLNFNSLFCLYEQRCQCKEQIAIINRIKKKRSNRSRSNRSKEKSFEYPKLDETNEIKYTTFQIKYEKKLSPIAKLVLNSFHNKYIYYAIDDILYSFKSNSHERDNLLAILYSPVLSLQNNFSINFFDIWIDKIYINEVSKVNKFLRNDSLNFEQYSYITIELFYKPGVPIKKLEPLW